MSGQRAQPLQGLGPGGKRPQWSRLLYLLGVGPRRAGRSWGWGGVGLPWGPAAGGPCSVRAESARGRGQSYVRVPELEGGMRVRVGGGLTHLELHVVPALLRRRLLRPRAVVLDRLHHDVLHPPLQLRGGE